MKSGWLNGRLATAAVVTLGLVGAAHVYGVSMAPRVQAPATAVAVVDVAKIMLGMELVKTESAKLKADFDAKQKSLTGMQDKIKNLAEQVKSAKDGSAEKRALAFDQIKAEAELKMTGELFQRQLNLSQGDLYKQAFLEVSGAIDQVAKQNGYQLVLRNDADVQLPANISGQDMENFIANQRVFYADSSLDITEQVVQLLNNQFKAGGKKK